MRLQLSTWQEVDAYLSRSKGIIIPIGSTEQHGPNGLIGTDAICPEFIAKGVAEKIDVLVAPTINVGIAQHHLGFAGSMALRPSTLIAVITDMVASLAHHGFERCYFLNGHGGNIATITAAFAEIYTNSSLHSPEEDFPLRCKLSNWYMGLAVQQVSKELFADAEGSHATPSEVSLTYFAHPDAIKKVAMSPQRAPTGPVYTALDFRQRFPDGRIGSEPALASTDSGEKLFHAAVRDITADYQAFLRTR
ncbi:MAG TPA: creatininase family protein [Gammaproteobacteria bacterium]|nr:creatininase family protein [Gammaproteobacteria bacterium]